MISQIELSLPAFPRGCHLVTELIVQQLSLPEMGLLHLFLQHTSAGLTLNENADPDVRHDLEQDLNRLVPEHNPPYRHTLEGSDDMPAHTKSALIGNSLSIPFRGHRLQLGTWQGIWLCEFRNQGGRRRVLATLIH